MSRLTDLRAAAIVRIQVANLGFKSVDKHVGRYTVDDLKRLLSVSPACAVGIANVTHPMRRASGELAIDVAFVGVIVTKQQRRDDADDDALDLAVQVAALINDWVPAEDVPRVLPAADIRADGAGDDELDRAQMAVWAVTWMHTVTIGTDQVGAGTDTERRLGRIDAITIGHAKRGDEIVGGAP